MPTEHELKYILDLDRKNELIEIGQTQSSEIRLIEQAFIQEGRGWAIRIRKELIVDKKTIYTLTYKHRTYRQIEITKKIDQRDYSDLWKESQGWLRKTRYIFPFKNHDTWELDLFYRPDVEDIYFAMAEVEIPEEATQPSITPPWLNEYLIFTVPYTDTRFSNKKLRDVHYAERLYREIVEAS